MAVPSAGGAGMGGRWRTPRALATAGRAHSSRCPHVTNGDKGLLGAWADLVLGVRTTRRAGGFPSAEAISGGRRTAAAGVTSPSTTEAVIPGDFGWTGENTDSWTRTRACSDGDGSLPLNSGCTQTCKYRGTFPQAQSCFRPMIGSRLSAWGGRWKAEPWTSSGRAGGTTGVWVSLQGVSVFRSRRQNAIRSHRAGLQPPLPALARVAPFPGLRTDVGLRGRLLSNGGIMPGTACCFGSCRCCRL